jgi:hypothetical protein
MKPLTIGIAVTFGIAVVIFVAAFALLLLVTSEIWEGAAWAATLAGLPALLLPRIAEFVERAAGRRSWAAGKQATIQDYCGFQVGWPWTVAYGFLALMAWDGISTFVVASIAGAADGTDFIHEDTRLRTFVLALAINLPALMLGGYLISRWIGIRCARMGLVAVLIAVVLFTAVTVGISALAPAERYDVAFLRLNLSEFPFILVCGLIGYWRGRKARWSKYLDYLVRVIPPATRDRVVGLAFTEVQKAAAANRSESA